MVEGNDGGANVSRNRGKSWTGQQYATGQFYHVSTTDHFPYRICGAQQDNSTVCGPSRFPGGIPLGEWKDGLDFVEKRTQLLGAALDVPYVFDVHL